MRTISQIAKLTGVSIRTLQYYDEIGLLKPSEITSSGYRLYDDDALERLQQILFFKEMDFKLREIKEFVEEPGFDKIEAYKKQKKLLCLKRSRLDKLIELLEKLEKGEQCMSFKEFDLSEYIGALEQFKKEKTEEVIKYWGSVDKFNEFIQKVKDDQETLAPIAIKQFGSVEKYTEAMKYNLEHFQELMEQIEDIGGQKDDILKKNDDLQVKLTSDLTKDPTSEEIQDIMHELMELSKETSIDVDMGEGYWDMVIDIYTGETGRKVMDEKYGEGASEFMAKALHYYIHKQEL
ncbi:MerR family transcriptional regulator [uncultured Robinsoniella sp.]|uniref:MerR family transcriptional regulator n=1 Tax=uncultured Robinsoniella sp. TaxID=904190 RepID=UPI00374E576B